MSSRTNAQAATSQSTSKTSPLVLEANAVTQGHTANRKSKGTKQNQHSSQHHGHSPLEQHSQPPPPVPQHQEPPPERLSPAPLTHSSHPERASNTRHSSEDSDITSLIEAMDKDFDHHDSPPLDVFTEQPPSPLSKSKGNLLPFRRTRICGRRPDQEQSGLWSVQVTGPVAHSHFLGEAADFLCHRANRNNHLS